ncbi:AraC family transcriptional regulator [Paenibacillus hodogayensis]|uniref:AraC family transcriptional regulator n=1 Tax=Paenibacillus hodogayensis TaxID=279208 RepID=A0ABV5W8B9_9BACL
MINGFSADWSLMTTGYKYWRKIEHFMLEADTYPDHALFAVEEGSFSYEIGDHRGEATFGDLVLCPPGVSFKRKTLHPLSFHFVTFRWVTSLPVGTAAFPEGKVAIADTKRLSSTYRYLRQGGCKTPHILNHYIRDIWQQAALESAPPVHADSRQAESPLMNQALCYIQDNAFDTMSLGRLAKELNMTPVQLTRRFRCAFGQTPSEYITELRLGKACTLLEETSLSLDQIAVQCGYENGFYLSRIFTRKKAVSPSQYRKAHQV